MDIDVDNEFLNNLLKSAVAGTGIPANYIDASQDVDFARTLAMQNQSFVRTLVNYQNDYSNYYTEIVRRLYQNEFLNNEKEYDVVLDDIKVVFPPPVYLSLTNTNDQIGNASSTMDFLAQLFFPDDPSDDKIEYKKILFKKGLAEKYFLPTMEWEMFSEIKNNVMLEMTTNEIKNAKDKEEDEGSEDEGSDDF